MYPFFTSLLYSSDCCILRFKLAACLLFGFSTGLTVYLGNPSLGMTINENLLSMLPYIVTLVMLVLFVRTSKAPAALGNPYKKGER